jgi:arginase
MEIALVAVPFQLDMARWGYAQGPSALLEHGLAERLAAAGHAVKPPVWVDLPREERTRDSVTNLGRIARRTAAAVRVGLEHPDAVVVVLEGDCSHAVGAIGGLAQGAGDAGVVWFDAHGDLHTMATTTSGYLGGMPYAVALGWEFADWRIAAGLEPPVRVEAAALLGTSDLDDAEVAVLARQPIFHQSAQDLAPDQITTTLGERAAIPSAWYLHIDVDVAGVEVVPGGMTPAPHPPALLLLLDAIAAAARSVRPRVIGLATYNPQEDPTGRGANASGDLLMAAVSGLSLK